MNIKGQIKRKYGTFLGPEMYFKFNIVSSKCKIKCYTKNVLYTGACLEVSINGCYFLQQLIDHTGKKKKNRK